MTSVRSKFIVPYDLNGHWAVLLLDDPKLRVRSKLLCPSTPKINVPVWFPDSEDQCKMLIISVCTRWQYCI